MRLDKGIKLPHNDYRLYMKKGLKVVAVIILAIFFATGSSFAQYVPTLDPAKDQIQSISPKLLLKKRAFMPWENLSLSYEGEAKPLEVRLTNVKGEDLEFQAVLRDRDGKVLDIEIPKNVKPGKFHLLVKDGETKLVDEDVFWGISFANQNQSVLEPGQVGKSNVVLFSSDGTVLCEKEKESSILNTITSEEKKQTIPKPQECSKEKPGFYETIFQTDNIGTYLFKLKDDESGQELISNFDVVNSTPFEVKRDAPTFVKKDNEYQVKLTLVANEDFEGSFNEFVPAMLEPSNLDTVDVKNPDAVGDDESTMNLALPFKGDFPITLHFEEEPDAETHLLEAYHAYGVKAHDGVDFAVSPGTEIISVDDGEVVEIPDHAVAYGLTVVVQHSWGKSYYGHLSETDVKPGDKVKKGDLLALSGNTGLSTGPHLHFGIEPNDPDASNGYLGKIDPLRNLSIKNKFKTSKKKLTWNLSVKTGETVTVGYKIKPANEDNYLISETKFSAKTKEDRTVFEEKNPWTYVVVKN